MALALAFPLALAAQNVARGSIGGTIYDTSGGIVPDAKLTFSKVDGVFRSGNATRDTIPTHLVVGRDVPPEVAAFYAHMCPAGVYELPLRVNAPNCIDCKATDVLGPRWTPREGGSGPKYKRM